MSSSDWLKRCALTMGAVVMLTGAPAMAEKKLPPGTIHEPGPATQTPVNNDLGTSGEKPVGNLMLKNADQINLLNALATMDMSFWPSTLKKNRSYINDEFIQVMSNRSKDAMQKGLQAYIKAKAAEDAAKGTPDKDRKVTFDHERDNRDKEKNGYVEISFRYALLADLCAGEIGHEKKYRLELAAGYSKIPAGGPMAMAILGNIIITDPNHVGARILSGDIRASQGDFYGAMVDYQAALKKDPNNAHAWTVIAKAHLIVNDFKKAKEALNKAVACTAGGSTAEAKALLEHLEHPAQLPPASDPMMAAVAGPREAQTPEGMALAAEKELRQNNVIVAFEGFNNALKKDPTNARAHMGLGDIAFRKSDFQQAIDQYNLAAKYSPNDAVPMYYMGLACEKVYDTTKSSVYIDRALECVTNAIRLKTDYGAAREAQERLMQKKVAETAAGH